MLNNVQIAGRLTADPQLRYTKSQTAVCSFTVAVDDDYQKDGEKSTQFIECVAWRKTAEFMDKYLEKGSLVIVSGRLVNKSWEDKDSGKKLKSNEILVENIYPTSWKKKESSESFEDFDTAPVSREEYDAQFEDMSQESDSNFPF